MAPAGPPSTGPLARPWPVTALAVLDFIAAAIILPLAVVGTVSQLDKGAAGIAVGCVFIALGLASLGAALGMLGRKPWGRRLQLALAVVGLLGFPVGTVLAVLAIVYLLKPGARVLFSGRPAEELTVAEHAAVLGLAPEGGGAMALVAAIILLVVVAFTGIVAAIAVPNLLNAINRGRQKRTMSDIRSIATALESYAVDHDAYPTDTAPADLANVLEPTYIRVLPRRDGWDRELRVVTWQHAPDAPGPDSYVIASAGKDGAFETASPVDYTAGATTDFAADIVYADGVFVRYPEGRSR